MSNQCTCANSVLFKHRKSQCFLKTMKNTFPCNIQVKRIYNRLKYTIIQYYFYLCCWIINIMYIFIVVLFVRIQGEIFRIQQQNTKKNISITYNHDHHHHNNNNLYKNYILYLFQIIIDIWYNFHLFYNINS